MKNLAEKCTPYSKSAFHEALLRLLSQKEFQAITVTEIADLAGYQRGTFYLHYNSKEDLIEELISQKLQVIFRFNSIYARKLPLEEYKKIFNHIYENAAFFTIMFSEKRTPGFLTEVIKDLTSYLNEKEFSPRGTDEFYKEFMLVYHATATIGHFLSWVQTDFKYSPDYMSKITKYILEEKPLKDFFNINFNDLQVIAFQENREEKKTDRRIIRTKKLIKNAFLELIEIKDYDTISMTDLANYADVNRSTLYSYYPDKNSLTIEMLDELMEGLTRSIFRTPTTKEREVEGQGKLIITRLFQYLSENTASFNIIFGENRVPGANQRFIREIKEILNIILNSNKALDAEIKSNSDIVVNVLSSALLGVIGHWVEAGLHPEPYKMAKLYSEIFCSRI